MLPILIRHVVAGRCLLLHPAALVMLLAAVGTAPAAEPPLRAVPTPLCIVGPGMRVHRFSVEVADEPAEQRRGLMYRRALPPDHGMIFVHSEPQRIVMWMKNTYVSLDMLFIRGGRVTSIAARTTPHSEKRIRSEGLADAVLEIAGGEAERRGLRRGDRVLHPALGASCP